MTTFISSVAANLFGRTSSGFKTRPTVPADAGAGASAPAEDRQPDFFTAACRGDIPALMAHLDRTPSLVSAEHVCGGTALHIAVAADRYEAVDLLLARGADPNSLDPMAGESPLHLAIITGSRDLICLLISRGADPDLATPLGLTSRAMARMYGQKIA